MRKSKYIGVTLIGLLVVAAISVTAGSGRKPPTEQQATVSLRLISVSEMMDFLHRFPEMLSGYSASERNDTGYLGQAFRFTEVTAAPLEHAFPAARFYRGQSFETSESPSPYLMAVAGDKRYAMPIEFNRLLLHNGLQVTDKNTAELAEAFVISAVGSWYRSFPEITFLGATSTSPAIKATNSKRTMIMGERAEKLKVKIGEQTEDWYFYIQRSQFIAVTERDAKGLITGSYLPAMVRFSGQQPVSVSRT